MIETRFSFLRQKWIAWLRLKKLEEELRSSEKFQKECEKIQCPTLAGLEKAEQERIREKIWFLKKKTPIDRRCAVV